MAERRVTFTGPNEMNHLHQRLVMDKILDHLGIEVINIKGECYVIRDFKRTPMPDELAAKGKKNAKVRSVRR